MQEAFTLASGVHCQEFGDDSTMCVFLLESLPRPYRFLGEGKNAASLKQIRAALSFAYKHWGLKNPFAKIEPPLFKEPQIHYLLLSDIRQLLDYLKVRQQGYGSALAFNLANALFQTACGLRS